MSIKKRIYDRFTKIIKSLIFNGNNITMRKMIQLLKHFLIIFKKERIRKRNEKKYNINIPPFCVFSVTWKCNLNCSGCCAVDFKHKKDLSEDEIERIISQANDLGTYFFLIVGGEPLMIKNIIDILGKNKDSIFLIFTNGTLMDDDKLNALKKYYNIIPVISIEGDINLSDVRRGKGVGEKIQELIRKFKSNKIAFGFSSMATHLNIDHITSREYLNELIYFGAVFGFIVDYIPFKSSINNEFILTRDDYRKKSERLAQRKKDSNIMIFNFPADEYEDEGCGSAGKSFVHINADGYVEPCPFSHYAVDNIKDKTYLEVLNSDFFKKLREKISVTDNDGLCMLFEHDNMVKKIAEETGAIQTYSAG
jgi:MoaA/NifB/PqqE/SkfB family radical SAM enzyme